MTRKHEGKEERARSIPGGAGRQYEDDGKVEDGADVADGRELVAGDPPVAVSSVDQAPLEFLCQKNHTWVREVREITVKRMEVVSGPAVQLPRRNRVNTAADTVAPASKFFSLGALIKWRSEAKWGGVPGL